VKRDPSTSAQTADSDDLVFDFSGNFKYNFNVLKEEMKSMRESKPQLLTDLKSHLAYLRA
jgi:hypothetical protein